MRAGEALDRLRGIKGKAEEADSSREAYQRFIACMRDYGGWTDAGVSDYAASIKVLMGKDDAAALALFEPGYYPTAEAARASAVECWRQYQ
jgi:hypothetical protein